LEAGEIDYIQSFFLLKQEVARLRRNPAVQVAEGTDLPGNFLLFFNTTRKPLDDGRVRKALAMATNRQQIVDQAVFGLGRPGKSAIHVGLGWAHNPEVDYGKLYPYDPAKANAALDAAGLERGADGKRFSVTLTYTVSQAGFTPMAEIIRNNWQAVGVDVRLEPYENQLALEKVFARQDFDVSLWPYTTAGDPAIGITRAYVTTPAPPKPFTNPTGYGNPRLDELFARAVATPSRDVRRRAYFEAQRIIAEDLPVLNLVDRIEVDAASAKLRNVFVSAEPYDLWDRVWTIDGKPSR
ncbi:MAG TPA: ABC transporter substrate-binding protein, partial [Thermodesulfobacteriota bacterium]